MLKLLVCVVSLYLPVIQAQFAGFLLDGNLCSGHVVTLGCTINSFSSSAIWNRNGTDLATCFNTNPCSKLTTTIEGIVYEFNGNTSGIYVTIQGLTSNENGINWTCTHTNPNIYQVILDDSQCQSSTTEVTGKQTSVVHELTTQETTNEIGDSSTDSSTVTGNITTVTPLKEVHSKLFKRYIIVVILGCFGLTVIVIVGITVACIQCAKDSDKKLEQVSNKCNESASIVDVLDPRYQFKTYRIFLEDNTKYIIYKGQKMNNRHFEFTKPMRQT